MREGPLLNDSISREIVVNRSWKWWRGTNSCDREMEAWDLRFWGLLGVSHFFMKNLCPVGAHTGALLSTGDLRSSSSGLWSGCLGYRIRCCLSAGNFQTLNLALWGVWFHIAHWLHDVVRWTNWRNAGWTVSEGVYVECTPARCSGSRQCHHLELYLLDI